MTRFLKQSTAVDLNIGPFLDSVDGITEEGSLTITQPDVRLSKAGGAFAQKSAAQTLSHQENGWYQVNLSTTDTNTLGPLILAVDEAGAVPIWHEFMVMPANVWDSLFGADLLDVNVAQWLGTAAATPTVAGVPEVDMTHLSGDSAAADLLELFAEALSAGGLIDNGTFAAGAIDAAALAADAVNEIWAKAGAEPGGVPAHTAAVLSKIDFIYAALRNKVLQTATLYTLRNDADNADLATAAISDNGTTLTRNELA